MLYFLPGPAIDFTIIWLSLFIATISLGRVGTQLFDLLKMKDNASSSLHVYFLTVILAQHAWQVKKFILSFLWIHGHTTLTAGLNTPF